MCVSSRVSRLCSAVMVGFSPESFLLNRHVGCTAKYVLCVCACVVSCSLCE